MNQLGAKLRSLRKSKGLSLVELAKRARCSPSYLSMVENGKVDPSISRLKRIAEALGITIVELFQSQTEQGTIVVRRDERVKVDFVRSKTRIETLVPPIPTRQLDARVAIVEPGGSSDGYYRHPGEEFGLVLKGSLELMVDGVVYTLQEGDSFYFQSSKDHRFRNPGGEETVVVWVNHPPSF